MRALVIGVWALAALVGCGEGCGCDAETDGGESRQAPPREPVEPPEELTWEASVSGAVALEEVREQLPPQLRGVVPATPGALLERIAAQLPLRDRVEDGADLWALGVEVDGRDRRVLATRVRLGEGPLPLGPDLPLLSGAPHDGQWIGAVPGRDDDAAMILDDVLLVSDSPEAMAVAAPYLAFTLVPRGAPPGIRLRLPEGVVAEDLRRTADRVVSRQASDASAAAREERERHERPPTYGDPEALVTILRDLARDLAAYLPDVGETTLSLGAGEAGLRLAVDADVRPGSPLEETLAAATTGEPFGLGALPASTALAWGTRSERDEESSFLAEALVRVGGDRLDARGREALADLDRSVGESRGEGVVVAFGSAGTAPWALAASAPAAAPLEPGTVQHALGAAYVRDVVAGLTGCQGAARGTRADRGTLCTTASGEPVTLQVAGAEGAWAVSITRGTTNVAEETAARLTADAGGGIGDHPDVSRVLASVGNDALLAVLLVPSRLVPAASLLPFAPLQQAAPETAGAARTAPLLFAASRTDRGIRLELVATAAAIEDLAAVIEPFVAD